MYTLKKILAKIVLFIGSIHWKAKRTLLETEQNIIRSYLASHYLIILTRRRNHLSTFFINLADFLLTGKWGFWSHALMNLEDEVTLESDFRLMEATAIGVHYSPFDKVFDVQNAVLLKPKNMTLIQWTKLLDRAKEQLGKPYDTLFNIKDAKALSCVELVRFILQGEPNYDINFANFEALIKKHKNLSPQMIYDCGDFDVVYISNSKSY